MQGKDNNSLKYINKTPPEKFSNFYFIFFYQSSHSVVPVEMAAGLIQVTRRASISSIHSVDSLQSGKERGAWSLQARQSWLPVWDQRLEAKQCGAAKTGRARPGECTVNARVDEY